jgi:hypothetical protein
MAAVETETEAAPRAGLAPVGAKDRIYNLDMLRGWAILGILAVNAISFAWPFQLTMSEAPPPGVLSQADVIGLWVTDVFFADKMRTLFTMLFGVSVFLVGGERSDSDRGRLLRRRLLWLGLIGAIHGMVFWYGDILLHYAYCGLLLMLMRSWSARRLLWIGGSITLLWGLVATGGYWAMANLPAEFAAKMEAGMPAADPAAIQAAIDLARRRFAEPVKVGELAAAAGLSLPQLDRALRRTLGLLELRALALGRALVHADELDVRVRVVDVFDAPLLCFKTIRSSRLDQGVGDALVAVVNGDVQGCPTASPSDIDTRPCSDK